MPLYKAIYKSQEDRFEPFDDATKEKPSYTIDQETQLRAAFAAKGISNPSKEQMEAGFEYIRTRQTNGQ